MSNLGARVASAVVMVPVIIAAVIWLPEFLWVIAVCLVAGFAAREVANLGIAAGVQGLGLLMAFGAYAITFVGAPRASAPVWVAGADVQLGATVALVVLAFLGQLLRPPEHRSVAAWAMAVAIPAYIGGMAAFIVRLHALDDGIAWVLCMFILIWTNDSAAYFGGRAFGRHPLAPALSPKKTWEGLAVGTVATVAAALGLAALAPRIGSVRWAPHALTTAPIWAVAALGLAVSIAGPFGDLSHSFIKRQFGAKDSSNVIPGHGGIWDRIDSLLFAAPVVYLVARLLGA